MSTQNEDVTLLEKRMQATFGVSSPQQLQRERGHGRVSRAYLNTAIRIVDRSGVVEQLAIWRGASVKSAAGAKAVIPFRAVLVLFVLHVQLGLGVNFHQIASTLDIRFGAEELALLNISNRLSDQKDWYHRLWRASTRMMKLIDPFPAPRNRRLRPNEFAELRAKEAAPHAKDESARNLERLDWLCERLLHETVRMLPADIWSKYKGNVSIDATLIPTTGAANPTDGAFRRGNADPHSGRYMREGNHLGKGAKTDRAGYELEVAVMAWNKPGENKLFPSLITAVGFHRPGEIRGAGARLMNSQKRLGCESGLIMADRAYNNAKPENFQIPIRKAGYQLVIDYKSNDLGLQSTYDDIILVDGNWYVTTMPQQLIDVTKHYAAREDEIAKLSPEEKQAEKAAYEKLLAGRDAYRMKPKGTPDEDGYQRFLYPKPGTYFAYDRATGKPARKPKTPATITVKLDAGASNKESANHRLALKHVQKFAYGSEEHRAHYGMRNLVESANKTLKEKNFEDIANPSKRSGRGFAFNYLASTLAAVSANLRKIVNFFTVDAEKVANAPATRERRRKDSTGKPLSKHSALPALAPPR